MDTPHEYDAHVKAFEFFTRPRTWVEMLSELHRAEKTPAPRKRKIIGRAALRAQPSGRALAEALKEPATDKKF